MSLGSLVVELLLNVAMKKSIRFFNDREVRAVWDDRIDDREIFMKGIDYSYYYEQEDGIND